MAAAAFAMASEPASENRKQNTKHDESHTHSLVKIYYQKINHNGNAECVAVSLCAAGVECCE